MEPSYNIRYLSLCLIFLCFKGGGEIKGRLLNKLSKGGEVAEQDDRQRYRGCW